MEHACVVTSWNDLISNTCLMGVRYAIFCNFISYVFCVSLVSFVYTDFVFRWYLLSIQILCFAGILLSIQILCFACILLSISYRFCVSLVSFVYTDFVFRWYSFVYTDFVFRLYSFVYTDFVFRWYSFVYTDFVFRWYLCLYRFCVSLVSFVYRFCVSLVFFCLYRFSFYCTVTSNTFIFKTLTYEEILSAYNFLKIFKCYDYPITAKN